MALEAKLKEKYGLRISAEHVFIVGIVLMIVAALFIARSTSKALSLALFIAPIWLPIVLVVAAKHFWIILKRSQFIASQSNMLLEIIPPREIMKTPLAMESVLSGLHLSPGEGTWYARSIQGKVRPWWSLEIVSLEGQVHFYIWTRSGFRRTIESQIYAQYPTAQVVEAPDYTRTISARTEDDWRMWGCDFTHTVEDPLPLKTYVEYGLDKPQKEKEQVDPLAHLIEFFGSMKKGEYLWVQFVIRVHKGEKYHKKNAKGKPYTWKDEAKKLIEDIRKETLIKTKYKDPATGKMVDSDGMPNPTKGQSEKMAAIERNVSKLAFDVGARGIYLSRPESFDPMTIAGLTGIFKQFSSESWNGIRPTGWMTEFNDYPWEIGTKSLKRLRLKQMIEAYRRRQFYHQPFDATDHSMVMSTEELATIYHLPSHGVETPGLRRIQSQTAAAPGNLPT